MTDPSVTAPLTPCPECHGTGKATSAQTSGYYGCSTCNGSGVAPAPPTVTLTMGLEDAELLRDLLAAPVLGQEERRVQIWAYIALQIAKAKRG